MNPFKKWWSGDDYKQPNRGTTEQVFTGGTNHHHRQGRRPPAPRRSSAPPRPRSPTPPQTSSLETLLENLDLGSDKTINVLLLGQTGVGKSTFINSLANYLELHQSLEDAENENLQVIIPTSFTVYDKNHIPQFLEVGENHKNENTQEVGASATQKIRTYKFSFAGGISLSLIDTPGMGDTRGIKQDEENCEYILNYLNNLKELHAICYLFRPQESRATAHFRYCITQILSRLEKSACNNIVFIFTDAKNFTPGETYSILKKMATDIKKQPPYVSIPVENNKFCFNNEPFQYLAAVQRGVEYDDAYKKAMKIAWKKSSEQCMKLIEYILNLKPHNVRDTAAINECRRVIFQLSQPMAQIAQLIDDNLYMLERHESQMNIDKNSLEELKDRLYIPIVDLEVKELPRPVTVCTDSKCAEIFMVGDRTKWHYKTRCHNPCYLTEVPKDIIGDPALIGCYAMSGSGQTCAECGCHYKVHMHVYYESETVNKQQVDEIVKQNVVSKEEVLENARKVIEETKKRRRQLQCELDVIIQYNAKFAHFVQNNAITPINDSYEDYIKVLIAAENRQGVNKDARKLDGLRQLLREHEKVKESLQKADEYMNKMGNAFRSVTPNDIQNCIKDLFKLTINGPIIKKMFDAQNQSRGKEYLDSEYVHPTFNGKKRQNKKQKGKSNNSYNAPSYSQALRGYPEVPTHDIGSENSDDDSSLQQESNHSSSRHYRDPARGGYWDIPERWSPGHGERFPDMHNDFRGFSSGRERDGFDRELREYPDDRFGRMSYRDPRGEYYYRERDFYPERFYGNHRDIPEMWGRYDYYNSRDPRQFHPRADLPEEVVKTNAEDALHLKNGNETGDSLVKDGLHPNVPRGEYHPREYGPPPPQFCRDYPESQRYRDVPDMYFPQRGKGGPEEFMAPNESPESKRDNHSKNTPENDTFGEQRPRESFGAQNFGTQPPRRSYSPQETFYPRESRQFRDDYPYRGGYPLAPFYRNDIRYRGYPEYAEGWGVPPQRDPRDFGYPRYGPGYYPTHYGPNPPAQPPQPQNNNPAPTGKSATVTAPANILSKDDKKTAEKPAVATQVVGEQSVSISGPTNLAVDKPAVATQVAEEQSTPGAKVVYIGTKEQHSVAPSEVKQPEGTKNGHSSGSKDWVVIPDKEKEVSDSKPTS